MNELTGKTVFVTGATGFLGGVLARRLAAEGVHVRALARRSGRDSHLRDLANIEIVSGDLSNSKRLTEIAQGCDTIFHVAAALGGTFDWQQQVNVEGTRKIMQAAAESNIRRVVHVSTISVYGYKNKRDVTETTPINPTHDPYSITKAAAEQVVRELGVQNTTAYSIIRPGMIYGPRNQAWTAGMFRIARRNPTIFIGDGSGSAYPIFVDDVADLTMLLATHPAAENETFNCTPDPSPTWREFIGAYMQLAGNERWFDLAPSIFTPIALLAGITAPKYSQRRDLVDLLPFIQRYITYRIDKARNLLSWQPKVSLSEGIARCAAWLHEIGLLA